MEGTTDYLKAHPYVAAGSAAVGGGLGYGLSHHFLDFEKPYAIGAGVASGAGLVLAEAWAWNTIEAFRTWLADSSAAAAAAIIEVPGVQATGEAADTVVKAVANSGVLPTAVSETMGADTASFDMNGNLIQGQHQLDDDREREAFHAWFFSKDTNKTAQWMEFIEAVRAKHGTTNFT